MSQGNNGLTAFFAFISGAAIGAGMALLFAPQSGKETRRQIKEYGDKVGQDMKDSLENIYEGAKEKIKKKPA